MDPKHSLPVWTEKDATVSRRDVVRGAGGIFALATLATGACTRSPAERIIPYRVQPEDVVPGRPSHYATAFTLDGYATGLIVESHEGRPTKVEGNPQHPSSLGATGVFAQALIAELYDPNRSRAVLHHHQPASLEEARTWLVRAGDVTRRGQGVHLVMPPSSSPSVATLLTKLRARLPELRVHFHAPVARVNAWEGARLALGAPLETHADLRQASVILALDCDFLTEGPAHVPAARAFTDRRRLESGSDDMNRLYVVESRMTVTGANADHRLALQDRRLPSFVAAVILEVSKATSPLPAGLRSKLEALAPATTPHSRFVRAMVKDLLDHRGSSVVLVGDRQAPEVHAAAHGLNALLENVGGPLFYGPSPVIEAGTRAHHDIADLARALDASEVEYLIVLDNDLAYASSADLRLSERIPLAKESLALGLFNDATARACTWSVPASHLLETWGDTRAVDGVASIVQPLIAPLHQGLAMSEALSAILGEPNASAYEIVRDEWRARWDGEFEAQWERTLQAGVVERSRTERVGVPAISWAWADAWLEAGERASRTERANDLELVIHVDARVHDGRFGDNPWLLELPCPVTKLTWGNAATMSPDTAARLGVRNGDVISLENERGTLEAPALIVPGCADGTLAIALGYGRKGEAQGSGVGANAYTVTASASPWRSDLRSARFTGRVADLAITQERIRLDGIEDSVLLTATLPEFRSHRNFAEARREKPASLYETDTIQAKSQWGMAIDLNACTGCSVCVIACQAENNTPTVGESGVLKGRLMHWLRIDRYVVGPEEAPRIVTQPMACQHCEKAPCEYVCPTAATVHSSDGLNQMVYNRCVGTRFCSNNCPYKVRRFNWFNYHADETPSEELAHNPNVTVRERGVMEKCTYCVQRIRGTEIRARVEGRKVATDEVVTACQQACPTNAIVFGDLADPASAVTRMHNADRAFAVLNDLGTVPRTRYLARITNPNPELA